jgi:hypothetical protein
MLIMPLQHGLIGTALTQDIRQARECSALYSPDTTTSLMEHKFARFNRSNNDFG